MTDQPARTAVISGLAWPTWNPTSEAHGVVYGKAAELADAHATESLAPVLDIVRRWYVDVNDGAGWNADDLIRDLEQAGYTLPNDA
jgi:hypothetical protein